MLYFVLSTGLLCNNVQVRTLSQLPYLNALNRRRHLYLHPSVCCPDGQRTRLTGCLRMYVEPLSVLCCVQFGGAVSRSSVCPVVSGGGEISFSDSRVSCPVLYCPFSFLVLTLIVGTQNFLDSFFLLSFRCFIVHFPPPLSNESALAACYELLNE